MTRDPIAFLDAVAGYAREENRQGSADKAIRLATIDPAYVPSSYPATLPKVTFDGESTLSGKRYTVITPGYLPHPSDRVVLLPVGNTYVIIGSVDQDAANYFGPTAWDTWVPVWASTGTQPAKGNGVLDGQYVQIGKTVHASLQLIAGSTTTWGTGTYTFTLPVAAKSTPSTARKTGSAYLRDTSAAANGHFQGITVIDPALSTSTFYIVHEPNVISATVPFAWANTDHITAEFTYQAA